MAVGTIAFTASKTETWVIARAREALGGGIFVLRIACSATAFQAITELGRETVRSAEALLPSAPVAFTVSGAVVRLPILTLNW